MGVAPQVEPDMRVCVTGFVLLLLVTAMPGAAQTRVIVVAGLGGEPEYEDRFARQAKAFATFLRDTTSPGDTAPPGDTAAQIHVAVGAQARAQRVREALAEFAGQSGPADQLVFIYVGHGSFDGEEFRFNVPGPDFTAVDLADWLAQIPAWQLVVVASSSSGAVLESLAHPRRTLMTATRSGDQSNATVFARYLLEALESESADVDKDTRLSLAEVFGYAEAAVIAHYKGKNLMASEHPQLANAGHQFTLARLAPDPFANPGSAMVSDRRDVLEAQINALKSRKDSLDSADYFGQLQRLLLEIAVIEKACRKTGQFRDWRAPRAGCCRARRVPCAG